MINLSWLQWPNSHCFRIDLSGPRRFKLMPKRDLVNQPLNTQCAVPPQNKTETSAQFGVGRTGQIQTIWRNKQPESHQILLWSGAIYRREESSEMTFELLGLKRGFVFTPVYQPEQWSAEVTSTVGCLCSALLTADWSWRGIALYFMNVMLQRGELGKKRENHSPCWVLSSVHINELEV